MNTLLKKSLIHHILKEKPIHLEDSRTFSKILVHLQLRGLVRREVHITVAETMSLIHLCLVSGNQRDKRDASCFLIFLLSRLSYAEVVVFVNQKQVFRSTWNVIKI